VKVKAKRSPSAGLRRRDAALSSYTYTWHLDQPLDP